MNLNTIIKIGAVVVISAVIANSIRVSLKEGLAYATPKAPVKPEAPRADNVTNINTAKK